MPDMMEWLNSITFSKEDLMISEAEEKEYGKMRFVIMRGLSMNPDLMLIVNELNLMGDVPHKNHYDFLRHMIPARKRYTKWAKKSKSEDISVIMKFYNMSFRKAHEVLPLMNKERMVYINSIVNFKQ